MFELALILELFMNELTYTSQSVSVPQLFPKSRVLLFMIVPAFSRTLPQSNVLRSIRSIFSICIPEAPPEHLALAPPTSVIVKFQKG